MTPRPLPGERNLFDGCIFLLGAALFAWAVIGFVFYVVFWGLA